MNVKTSLSSLVDLKENALQKNLSLMSELGFTLEWINNEVGSEKGFSGLETAAPWRCLRVDQGRVHGPLKFSAHCPSSATDIVDVQSSQLG